MSHPHSGNIFGDPSSRQFKTIVVMPSTGTTAFIQRGPRTRVKKFLDPHHALSWCLAKKVAFVLTPAD